ncbi:MAG TPA: 30S ribosomal protein S7 [Candidatus Woesearchaeota archaeon]|jgi:small subunit ribosomal protein S7|nr:30S ribosomal protein S7 [Candidatus Woesearchaeota archaeon]HJO01347.1 30S ribosomal protein S7 [Candidatus Woesearchaeota archaeon]
MLSQIKVFNRWGMDGIKVDDLGLKPYITLEPRIVPKTGARYAKNRFHKSKIFIVERLINKIMIPGHKSKKHFKTSRHTTGKANKALSIVENVFSLIEKQTKENPVKVFVKALENAAQREEIITIEYGGARYPKAVECAPQRRVDITLRHMTQGAYHKSFNSKKSIENCLAEEIINAYRLNAASNAISKKFEVERQADASR